MTQGSLFDEDPALAAVTVAAAPAAAAPASGDPVTAPADLRRDPARIVAAVDGASRGNPGPAGWAWVIDADRWAAGGWVRETNNVAELTALLELLRATEPVRHLPLEVIHDSTYARDCVTKWVHGWRRNGWRTSKKEPVKNREIIEAIADALAGRPVTFTHVRGHRSVTDGGHPLNAQADTRCGAAADAAGAGRPIPSGPGFSR